MAPIQPTGHAIRDDVLRYERRYELRRSKADSETSHGCPSPRGLEEDYLLCSLRETRWDECSSDAGYMTFNTCLLELSPGSRGYLLERPRFREERQSRSSWKLGPRTFAVFEFFHL